MLLVYDRFRSTSTCICIFMLSIVPIYPSVPQYCYCRFTWKWVPCSIQIYSSLISLSMGMHLATPMWNDQGLIGNNEFLSIYNRYIKVFMWYNFSVVWCQGIIACVYIKRVILWVSGCMALKSCHFDQWICKKKLFKCPDTCTCTVWIVTNFLEWLC